MHFYVKSILKKEQQSQGGVESSLRRHCWLVKETLNDFPSLYLAIGRASHPQPTSDAKQFKYHISWRTKVVDWKPWAMILLASQALLSYLPPAGLPRQAGPNQHIYT